MRTYVYIYIYMYPHVMHPTNPEPKASYFNPPSSQALLWLALPSRKIPFCSGFRSENVWDRCDFLAPTEGEKFYHPKHSIQGGAP